MAGRPDDDLIAGFFDRSLTALQQRGEGSRAARADRGDRAGDRNVAARRRQAPDCRQWRQRRRRATSRRGISVALSGRPPAAAGGGAHHRHVGADRGRKRLSASSMCSSVRCAGSGRPGDVFLAISTSGRSPNILRALQGRARNRPRHGRLFRRGGNRHARAVPAFLGCAVARDRDRAADSHGRRACDLRAGGARDAAMIDRAPQLRLFRCDADDGIWCEISRRRFCRPPGAVSRPRRRHRRRYPLSRAGRGYAHAAGRSRRHRAMQSPGNSGRAGQQSIRHRARPITTGRAFVRCRRRSPPRWHSAGGAARCRLCLRASRRRAARRSMLPITPGASQTRE